MSPLSGFLAVIVFFTAILVAYLTKQFQNENLNYSSCLLYTSDAADE